MSYSEESDQEHQEFIADFFELVQDFNRYYQEKQERNRTARFFKNAKARRKAHQINFKMLSSYDENVSEIITHNKNYAEKLVKPMRNQTKNLDNSQVEPYICNIHQILRFYQKARDLKLIQQILRNVQKQVYLNLFEQSKNKPLEKTLRRSCLHVYLAEKIYADKMKEAALCKTSYESQNIVIPYFRNPSQSRKGSTD